MPAFLSLFLTFSDFLIAPIPRFSWADDNNSQAYSREVKVDASYTLITDAQVNLMMRSLNANYIL
jgi:hypothetical protein